jgi:hypothetical protein
MPIPVVCPRCKKRMRAPAALAGTTAKCTGCQYDVEVPLPAPAPPARDEQLELLRQMAADLKAVRSNVGWIAIWFVVPLLLAGIAFVFVVMSLLTSSR